MDEKENVIIDRWLDLNKSLIEAEAERIGLEAQSGRFAAEVLTRYQPCERIL